MKPRVLVLSRSSWDDTNNTGNTLSNLFKNWDKENIANLYCRDELPNNKICSKYFKISESLLFKKLIRKTSVAGFKHGFEHISKPGVANERNIRTEKKIYDFFRNNRWYVFLWLRELLWNIVNWKSKELDDFVNEFQPEIIFAPAYDSFYMHKILFHLKKNSNAKIVVFHCDDYVTYRQYSLSPFFWINRFLLRKYVDRTVKNADKNYCIIDEQATIYKKNYSIEFDLLYKSGDFNSIPSYKSPNNTVKMVYTGNIIYGRMKSIIEISEALSLINSKEKRVELDIYTLNSINKNDYQKLMLSNSVNIKGKVSFDNIPNVLRNADVLLHVESLEKNEMFSTSLSFSTKLIDYLIVGKPIFAVGWENSATIKYLNKNKISTTCTNIKNVRNDLDALLNDVSSFEEIGHRNWLFGRNWHNEVRVLVEFENQLSLLKNRI